MFLITGAKGTDREFFLPVNIDIDPLPFIRPAAQPVSVINHPPFIRMEARSLAPLGSRRVPYKVPGASAVRAGPLPAVVPHAQPHRAHVLHAVLRFDRRDAAGDDRGDARFS